MKKLLADFLKLKEENIVSYKFDGEHGLQIGSESDFSTTYPIIEGTINQPTYEVFTSLPDKYYWVSLEELLVFIYNK